MKNLKQMIIETNHVRVVCKYSKRYATQCAGCGKDVEFVTFQEAANIARTSVDAIIKQVAKGKLHLGIRPEALLVCLNSLLRVEEFWNDAQMLRASAVENRNCYAREN